MAEKFHSIALAGAILAAAGITHWGLDKISKSIAGKSPSEASAPADKAAQGSSSIWDKFLKVADGFDTQSKALAEQAKQNAEWAKSLRDGVTELQGKLAPLKKAAGELP